MPHISNHVSIASWLHTVFQVLGSDLILGLLSPSLRGTVQQHTISAAPRSAHVKMTAIGNLHCACWPRCLRTQCKRTSSVAVPRSALVKGAANGSCHRAGGPRWRRAQCNKDTSIGSAKIICGWGGAWAVHSTIQQNTIQTARCRCRVALHISDL